MWPDHACQTGWTVQPQITKRSCAGHQVADTLMWPVKPATASLGPLAAPCTGHLNPVMWPDLEARQTGWTVQPQGSAFPEKSAHMQSTGHTAPQETGEPSCTPSPRQGQSTGMSSCQQVASVSPEGIHDQPDQVIPAKQDHKRKKPPPTSTEEEDEDSKQKQTYTVLLGNIILGTKS